MLVEGKDFLRFESYQGRRWMVGDVHGFIETFRAVIKRINPQREDFIFLLGDLIDRGPGSKEVIDSILELQKSGIQIFSVRGNHDDMFLKAHDDCKYNHKKNFLGFRSNSLVEKHWIAMGGDTTLKSFGYQKPDEMEEKYHSFFSSLPYYIVFDDCLLVHAGFDFNSEKPFEEIEPMMWIRDFVVDTKLTEGRKVIHGHTPVSIEFIQGLVRNPRRENFLVLDNGVMMKGQIDKGNLLAYELNTNTLIVQPNID